ncbi:MAG: hypothetical protein WKG07_30605 [Hymenobacter sp.]
MTVFRAGNLLKYTDIAAPSSGSRTAAQALNNPARAARRTFED